MLILIYSLEVKTDYNEFFFFLYPENQKNLLSDGWRMRQV